MIFVSYWGEPERAPHLWIKPKIVYIHIYIGLYIYVWYVHIPYMHSALFVQCNIPHVIHVERYSYKLATFESLKEVCTIHLWNPKKREKGYKA